MCATVYTWCHQVKATEVTAGLAESNGSLPPGLWCDSLHVTCGLTACTLESALGPKLSNEYGENFTLLHKFHLEMVIRLLKLQKYHYTSGGDI